MIDASNALTLARDAFTGSTTYFDANIRPELERDLRQFQSRHPTNSKYESEAYKGRARFFRPKTRGMVRSGEASVAEAFFTTSDVVSCSPIDEKNTFAQIAAEVLQSLLQYRLAGPRKHAIPWFQVVCGAFQDADVQGSVISHQGWDLKRDKPAIDLIPRENFRFDPAANWMDPIATSPYLIWLKPMYVKDVKERMAQGKWTQLTDAQIQSATKRYADTTRLLREGNRTDSTDKITAINDFSIVWVHMNIMADETGQDVMFYTLGTELLLSEPEPLTSQYAHCTDGARPFAMGKVVIETHRTDPSGEVRLVREIQGEANEIANQRIDNVKFAMNKRYFVRRNRQVDIRALTRNMPSSVTLMTHPEEDVKVIDTPDVTGSSYQEQDRLNLDFDEITGNMSQSSVMANRKLNETVGGLEILGADANKVKAYGIKTFIETWAEEVINQLIELEAHYETDENILALALGQSSVYLQMRDELGPIDFDQLFSSGLIVKVDVGMNATSPTQKINNLLTGINGVKTALADGVLEQYGVDATAVIKEIFGALGHRDGGKFFHIEGDEDPTIAALKQQILKLKQALDAKHPQALIDAQVKEIEARIGKADADKVAKMVEAIYSAMQAGEVIATVPQVAPVADKLMEAAGYQPPNPAGVDPNFPQPAQAVTPAGVEAAKAGPFDVPESGNTSPMFPDRPNSADAGAGQGIESDQA